MISYPITIVPVYDALAAAMGKKETKSMEEGEVIGANNEMQARASGQIEYKPSWIPADESVKLYWMINLMRSAVVGCSVLVVLLVYQYLDTFISVAGAVFGMANVLLLPALAHHKLLAKTKF